MTSQGLPGPPSGRTGQPCGWSCGKNRRWGCSHRAVRWAQPVPRGLSQPVRWGAGPFQLGLEVYGGSRGRGPAPPGGEGVGVVRDRERLRRTLVNRHRPRFLLPCRSQTSGRAGEAPGAWDVPGLGQRAGEPDEGPAGRVLSEDTGVWTELETRCCFVPRPTKGCGHAELTRHGGLTAWRSGGPTGDSPFYRAGA